MSQLDAGLDGQQQVSIIFLAFSSREVGGGIDSSARRRRYFGTDMGTNDRQTGKDLV
jgi:hypothetical protein